MVYIKGLFIIFGCCLAIMLVLRQEIKLWEAVNKKTYPFQNEEYANIFFSLVATGILDRLLFPKRLQDSWFVIVGLLLATSLLSVWVMGNSGSKMKGHK